MFCQFPKQREPSSQEENGSQRAAMSQEASCLHKCHTQTWQCASVDFKLYFNLQDREKSLPVGSLPRCLQQQGWSRSKPGAWNSVCVSHVGGSDTALWGNHCYFPRCALVGNARDQKQVSRIQTSHPHVVCGNPKQCLKHCAIFPSLAHVFYMIF